MESMEDIFLEKEVNISVIRSILIELFPDLNIFFWNLDVESTKNFNPENNNHIFFNTTLQSNKDEFNFLVSIFKTPIEDSQERALFIGKKMSTAFNLKVLVPFTNPEFPNDPYYDIIFDQELSFLTNDSDTNFADGAKGRLKILREYKLPEIRFDRKAKKISVND
jgi:hypothetical protein